MCMELLQLGPTLCDRTDFSLTSYVFIWLLRALVVVCEIFFSRGMWDLAPWPGLEPGLLC